MWDGGHQSTSATRLQMKGAFLLSFCCEVPPNLYSQGFLLWEKSGESVWLPVQPGTTVNESLSRAINLVGWFVHLFLFC